MEVLASVLAETEPPFPCQSTLLKITSPFFVTLKVVLSAFRLDA